MNDETTADVSPDPVREQVLAHLGLPMGSGGPSVGPDAVNLPMIRHWVDAFDDRNPLYDADLATQHGYAEIVAPPAMLQTWTMLRPQIAGIAERGGAPGDIDPDSPLAILADAGFTATLATNSDLEFSRYLRLGDQLQAQASLEAISELKSTALGRGYFVTWVTRYTSADDELVGLQRFRVYRFAPGVVDTEPRAPRQAAAVDVPERGEDLPNFDLDVTATVVVAGAIASRDFMPVHHDRDYAVAQGAPDIFMNILSSTGYVSRYVTDWSGPAAVVRGISIRLGAPAVPGKVLHFSGHVAASSEVADGRHVTVAVRADGALGNHLSGTVDLALPPVS